MALSDFPRMGFDPFAEMRRMQSEMNRLFFGSWLCDGAGFPAHQHLAGRQQRRCDCRTAGREPRRCDAKPTR